MGSDQQGIIWSKQPLKIRLLTGMVWRYLPKYQVSMVSTYSLHRWFQSSITYEWLRFCARKIEWKKCKISRCENCRWSSQIDYSWKGNTYKVHGIQRSTFYIPSTIKTQMNLVLQMLFGRLGKMNTTVFCTLECHIKKQINIKVRYLPSFGSKCKTSTINCSCQNI